MTVSILAFDEKSGAYGGAAATGSLCVGGWVLRGDPESGMSASQGTAPSTLWGVEVLARMQAGEAADAAVATVTSADAGAAHRQLATLDPAGTTGAFTGDASVPWCGAESDGPVIAAGNMLANGGVILEALRGYHGSAGTMAERLLVALAAAAAAGGDARGLQSAALLVVSRRTAPLSLRVDWSEAPLAALEALHARSQVEPYRSWIEAVPTLDEPCRALIAPPEPKDASSRRKAL